MELPIIVVGIAVAVAVALSKLSRWLWRKHDARVAQARALSMAAHPAGKGLRGW